MTTAGPATAPATATAHRPASATATAPSSTSASSTTASSPAAPAASTPAPAAPATATSAAPATAASLPTTTTAPSSTAAAATRPPSAPKRAPRTASSGGAKLSQPPLLRWRAPRRARFYNVQLYRSGVKILSLWPSRARLKLRRQWTYKGRVQHLRPGLYAWAVWPAFGEAKNPRYGRMLGLSSFRSCPADPSSSRRDTTDGVRRRESRRLSADQDLTLRPARSGVLERLVQKTARRWCPRAATQIAIPSAASCPRSRSPPRREPSTGRECSGTPRSR